MDHDCQHAYLLGGYARRVCRRLGPGVGHGIYIPETTLNLVLLLNPCIAIWVPNHSLFLSIYCWNPSDSTWFVTPQRQIRVCTTSAAFHWVRNPCGCTGRHDSAPFLCSAAWLSFLCSTTVCLARLPMAIKSPAYIFAPLPSYVVVCGFSACFLAHCHIFCLLSMWLAVIACSVCVHGVASSAPYAPKVCEHVALL